LFRWARAGDVYRRYSPRGHADRNHLTLVFERGMAAVRGTWRDSSYIGPDPSRRCEIQPDSWTRESGGQPNGPIVFMTVSEDSTMSNTLSNSPSPVDLSDDNVALEILAQIDEQDVINLDTLIVLLPQYSWSQSFMQWTVWLAAARSCSAAIVSTIHSSPRNTRRNNTSHPPRERDNPYSLLGFVV